MLSGLPFWEDSDDAILGNDDYLENREVNENTYSLQNDDIDSRFRNKLAEKIAMRAAAEKKAKRQLLQDLDAIKDRFAELEIHMKKQELDTSLEDAAVFLNELVTGNFYNLIQVLMTVVDSHTNSGTAQKEIIEIKHALKELTH